MLPASELPKDSRIGCPFCLPMICDGILPVIVPCALFVLQLLPLLLASAYQVASGALFLVWPSLKQLDPVPAWPLAPSSFRASPPLSFAWQLPLQNDCCQPFGVEAHALVPLGPWTSLLHRLNLVQLWMCESILIRLRIAYCPPQLLSLYRPQRENQVSQESFGSPAPRLCSSILFQRGLF